jgi:spore coat protein H
MGLFHMHTDRDKRRARRLVYGLVLVVGAGFCLLLARPTPESKLKGPLTSAELFNPTNAWTVHLTFTLNQWMVMEPNQGVGYGGFGGRRGPGRGMNLQGPEGKRNGLASAMGIEFTYVHADLEFAGEIFKNVAVRYKGNGTYMQSRNALKRSLKVELNKYVKGQKLAGVTKLNFHSCVTDASWMNEALAHRLYRDAGVPAPRTAYARVFVTVPGTFNRKLFGLYSLVEDVDTHFVKANFPDKDGALFKPVTPEMFGDLGTDWKDYNQTYDPKTKLSPAEQQRVIDFCHLVTNASEAEFAVKLGDFVDLDELSRYLAVMVFLVDLDGIFGPGQNFYLYLSPKTRRFSFIPWDQDHSFGQFGMRGSQEQREQLSIQHPWGGEKRFLERVYGLDSFQKVYLARLKEFHQTIFRPERFHQQVNDLGVALRTAVREESSDKFARFEQAVAGKTFEPGSFGGFGGGRRFGGPIKPIKPFVEVRAQSIADQLAGKSSGETIGGFGFGRGGRRGPGGFAEPP